MENRDLNFCFGCMRAKGEEDVCPRCGYKLKANPTGLLQPKDVVAERYIVGRTTAKNSQCVSYIGFDTETESRVEIKEFFPSFLAVRNRDNNVEASENREVLFKTLKSEFSDLYNKLSKLKTLNNIPRVFEVVEDRGTCYAVCEKKEFIKFSDYFSLDKGEWTVSRVKNMFAPLLATVATLNDMGILHKRISTETIYVDKNDMLNIGDFGIATLTETDNAGDDIIAGFAAPEIYDEKSETGNFTEVYALAAVIYNVLCSVPPPSAKERLSGAYLTTPSQLNPSVPEAVSDLVCKALELNSEDRIKSVRGFIELLEAVDVSEEAPEKIVEVKKPSNSKKKAVIVWSLVAVAMISLVSMIFVVLLGGNHQEPTPPPVFSSSSASSDVASSEETSSDTSSDALLESSTDNRFYATIDCVGKNYSDITKNMDYLLRFSFEPSYEYSDEVKEGVIIKQEPQPDEPLAYMGTIKVVVSKGPQFYDVPRCAGKTLEEYKEMLYKIGLTDDNIVVEESDNYTALPGYVSKVIMTSGGDKIDVEKLSEVELLVFYYPTEENESSEASE